MKKLFLSVLSLTVLFALMACGTRTMYMVSFVVQDGATTPAAVEIERRSTVEEPAAPAYIDAELDEFYFFDGWYTNAARTNAFDFSTPIEGDTTLYAGFIHFSEWVYPRNQTYISTSSNVTNMNPATYEAAAANDLFSFLVSPYYVVDFDWPKAMAEGIAAFPNDFSLIEDGTYSIEALDYTMTLDGILKYFPEDPDGYTYARDTYIYDTGFHSDKDFANEVTATEWIFELKEGLVWEDGTPITAETLEYTVKQYIDPVQNNFRQNHVTAEAYWDLVNSLEYFRQGKYHEDCETPENPAGICPTVDWEDVGFEVLDTYRFKMTSNSAKTQWNRMTQMSLVYLLHEGAYEDGFLTQDRITTNYGSIDNPLVSYGPYVMRVWQDETVYVFNKNLQYVSPHLFNYKSIRVEVMTDQTTIINEFEAGRLNVAGVGGQYFPDYVDDPGLYIIPGNCNFRLAINRGPRPDEVPLTPLVHNQDFRQALVLAMDRATYASTVAAPAIGVLSFVSSIHKVTEVALEYFNESQELYDMLVAEGYAPDDLGYQPELAKILFDQAYAAAVAAEEIDDGDTIYLDYTYADVETNVIAANWIKSQYEEVFNEGETFEKFELVLRGLDSATGGAFDQARNDGNFGLMFTGLCGVNFDASWYMGYVYNTTFGGFGWLVGLGHETSSEPIVVDMRNAWNLIKDIPLAEMDSAERMTYAYLAHAEWPEEFWPEDWETDPEWEDHMKYVGGYWTGFGAIDYRGWEEWTPEKQDIWDAYWEGTDPADIPDPQGYLVGIYDHGFMFRHFGGVLDTEYFGRQQDLTNLTVELTRVVIQQVTGVPMSSQVSAVVYRDVHISVPDYHSYMAYGGQRYRWLTSDPDFAE